MHGQAGDADECVFINRRDAAAHGGQAEFFYAEVAARKLHIFALGIFANQADAVHAQLGIFGNLPLAFGRLAACAAVAPTDGHIKALVCALMGNAHDGWGGVRGGCKPFG